MGILRLKEVLKEKGVSGKDLAYEIGVSKTSISQIITENQQPRFDLLVQIANTLDVDIRDLFYSTKQSKSAEETLQEVINTLNIVKTKLIGA